MNWIIRSNEKMRFHTYLDLIVEPIKDEVDKYNWVLFDIEMWTYIDTEPPIDMETDYFILPPSQFKILLSKHVQFYWGMILAVPIFKEIELDASDLPFVEGNESIWKNGNLQYPEAEIEIDCFDSGYTIVKFTNEALSEKFKNHFGDDAIPLEDFGK